MFIAIHIAGTTAPTNTKSISYQTKSFTYSQPKKSMFAADWTNSNHFKTMSWFFIFIFMVLPTLCDIQPEYSISTVDKNHV